MPSSKCSEDPPLFASPGSNSSRCRWSMASPLRARELVFDGVVSSGNSTPIRTRTSHIRQIQDDTSLTALHSLQSEAQVVLGNTPPQTRSYNHIVPDGDSGIPWWMGSVPPVTTAWTMSKEVIPGSSDSRDVSPQLLTSPPDCCEIGGVARQVDSLYDASTAWLAGAGLYSRYHGFVSPIMPVSQCSTLGCSADGEKSQDLSYMEQEEEIERFLSNVTARISNNLGQNLGITNAGSNINIIQPAQPAFPRPQTPGGAARTKASEVDTTDMVEPAMPQQCVIGGSPDASQNRSVMGAMSGRTDTESFAQVRASEAAWAQELHVSMDAAAATADLPLHSKQQLSLSTTIRDSWSYPSEVTARNVSSAKSNSRHLDCSPVCQSYQHVSNEISWADPSSGASLSITPDTHPSLVIDSRVNKRSCLDIATDFFWDSSDGAKVATSAQGVHCGEQRNVAGTDGLPRRALCFHSFDTPSSSCFVGGFDADSAYCKASESRREEDAKAKDVMRTDVSCTSPHNLPSAAKSNTNLSGSEQRSSSPSGFGEEVLLDEIVLTACGVCGRKFREERLDVHQNICRKASDERAHRVVFDSKRQRCAELNKLWWMHTELKQSTLQTALIARHGSSVSTKPSNSPDGVTSALLEGSRTSRKAAIARGARSGISSTAENAHLRTFSLSCVSSTSTLATATEMPQRQRSLSRCWLSPRQSSSQRCRSSTQQNQQPSSQQRPQPSRQGRHASQPVFSKQVPRGIGRIPSCHEQSNQSKATRFGSPLPQGSHTLLRGSRRPLSTVTARSQQEEQFGAPPAKDHVRPPCQVCTKELSIPCGHKVQVEHAGAPTISNTSDAIVPCDSPVETVVPTGCRGGLPQSDASNPGTKSIDYAWRDREIPGHASGCSLTDCKVLNRQVSSECEVATADDIDIGGDKVAVCLSPFQVREPPIPTAAFSQPHHINLAHAQGGAGGILLQGGVAAEDAVSAGSAGAYKAHICPRDSGSNDNALGNPVLDEASFFEVRDVFPDVNKLSDELVEMMGSLSVTMSTSGSLDSVEHSSITATVANKEKGPILPLTGTLWSKVLHESTQSMQLSGSKSVASMMEDVAVLGAQLDSLLSRQAELLGKNDIVCAPSPSATLQKNETEVECNSLPVQPYNPLRYCTCGT